MLTVIDLLLLSFFQSLVALLIILVHTKYGKRFSSIFWLVISSLDVQPENQTLNLKRGKWLAFYYSKWHMEQAYKLDGAIKEYRGLGQLCSLRKCTIRYIKVKFLPVHFLCSMSTQKVAPYLQNYLIALSNTLEWPHLNSWA